MLIVEDVAHGHQWELMSLSHLLATITNVNLCNFKQDHLIWKLEKEWVLSVKSLYKCLLASFCDMKLGMPFIWLGIAPPKVENLIWLISHGRLYSKY